MIYFDNSATTLPRKEAIDSFTIVSTKYFGNPSSLHGIGATAEQLLSQARKQVAQILDVKEQEIYFTSGGTEGNNMAIKGIAMSFRSRGKHLVVSSIEHPSVIEACEQLVTLGFEVTYVPVNESGRVRAKDVIDAIRKDTILVSIMHVNNEIGTIQPIEDIGNMLREFPKVFFHVDYVQGVGKVPLQLKASNIDLCTISGHKFHGLKGTGVLFVREGINLSPLFSGGSQERRLRSGTENVAGAVSLAKALRLTYETTHTEKQQMKQTQEYLRSELEKMKGVVVNTPTHHCAPHILNFSVPKIKSEVLVHALEDKDIYVSTTSACSSKRKAVSEVILAMTQDESLASSSIRISLSYENDINEAKEFIISLKNVLEKLEEVMR
ncbi:cysteine desulfurase family protein [Bacillus massiliigorillae]|uniref:cysteine desulfurase family protein n=1 Tax=Bacillus massiliigorillae TaxID=1243664 RepID=UPI00039F51CB|nr:cysteine desulfurase family protein [Bacillus massiliigorillae]